MGITTSLEQTFAFSRALSEREWELLVAESRTTFGGMGTHSTSGGLREWSNGTVQMFVEPTATGYRLRMTSAPSAQLVGLAAGAFLLPFGLFLAAVLIAKGDPGFKLFVTAPFILGGAATAGLSVMSLPRWAREQESGMARIGGFCAALLAAPALAPPAE